MFRRLLATIGFVATLLVFVVFPVAVRIRADVTVEEKCLAVLDRGIAVLEVYPALADGFHFGAEQHQPGFELVHDEIVVKCLPVGSHELLA